MRPSETCKTRVPKPQRIQTISIFQQIAVIAHLDAQQEYKVRQYILIKRQNIRDGKCIYIPSNVIKYTKPYSI